MSKKVLFAVVAIAVVIIICLFFVRRNNYKNAIISVLAQDYIACTVPEKSLSMDCSFEDRYNAVVQISQNQSRISLSSCPDVFRQAYRKHYEAWAQNAEFQTEVIRYDKKYHSLRLSNGVAGCVLDLGAFNDDNNDAMILKAHSIQVKNSITSTWHDVIDIAESYGVDVSQYQ